MSGHPEELGMDYAGNKHPLCDEVDRLAGLNGELHGRIDALTAKIDRLREALQSIADAPCTVNPQFIARRALADIEGDVL